MTKTKAITILKKFIEYKEQSVKIWSEDKFQTDAEDLRAGNERLARHDKDILEMILKELTEKNDSKRKK